MLRKRGNCGVVWWESGEFCRDFVWVCVWFCRADLFGFPVLEEGFARFARPLLL